MPNQISAPADVKDGPHSARFSYYIRSIFPALHIFKRFDSHDSFVESLNWKDVIRKR